MQRRPAWTAAVLLTCLVLAGCSAGSEAPVRSRPASTTASPSVGAAAPSSPSTSAQPAPAAGPHGSFTFAAAGDLGANRDTVAMLEALDASAAEFFLALGDLDYDETPSDVAWCGFVRGHLPRKGATFPFELVVGNHESDGGPDGRIRHFTGCLPDRLGATTAGGAYGAQYAFDYPRVDPYSRFILVAPQISAGGHTYRYGPGSPDRRWLVRQIDGARRAGIRWVVVGMHYPCLSTGITHGCDSGSAITNLLLTKHVDLVLAGHNHIYERSKQLRLSSTGCRSVVPEQYEPRCVVDTGADRTYTAGRGTVQVTAGTVGGKEQGINPRDGDGGYFAVNSDESSGFMAYTVTPRRLSGRWVRTSGTFRDSFSIVAR